MLFSNPNRFAMHPALVALAGAFDNIHYAAIAERRNAWGSHKRADEIRDYVREDMIDKLQENVIIPFTAPRAGAAWEASAKEAVNMFPVEPGAGLDAAVEFAVKLTHNALNLAAAELASLLVEIDAMTLPVEFPMSKSAMKNAITNRYNTISEDLSMILGWVGG